MEVGIDFLFYLRQGVVWFPWSDILTPRFHKGQFHGKVAKLFVVKNFGEFRVTKILPQIGQWMDMYS